MTQISIGDFIKKHRVLSGYKSQRQLADKTGISSATISRIEKDIQKPIPETLKDLSKYLTSTSYVELMVVAGYWDEDELLEPITDKTKETPSPHKSEKEFIDDIDLDTPDEQLLNKFNFTIDGKELTEREAKGILAYVRSLRQVDR